MTVIIFLFTFHSIIGSSLNFQYIYHFKNKKNSIGNGLIYFVVQNNEFNYQSINIYKIIIIL